MSTSPDDTGAHEDRVVSLLSHWLARHVDDDELRARLEVIEQERLEPVQAEAVDELLEELRHPDPRPGHLERTVRETLEAVALGG